MSKRPAKRKRRPAGRTTARSDGRTDRRADRLASLSALTRLITSATASDAVFRAIAEAATMLLKARMAWVWVVDPDGERLREGGSFGLAPEFAGLMDHLTIARGQGVVGAVLESGRAEYLEDVGHDPRFLNKRLAAAADLHACAALPLIQGEQRVGVLIVLFGRRNEFTPEERDIAGLLADQAAIAIEKTRLLEEADRRRREAEVVAELARGIGASLDLDTVLQRFAVGAKELCDSDMARIALRDAASERFVFRSRVGPCHPGWDPLPLEPGRGLGGQVLLLGRSLRTSNYPEDPRVPSDYAALARAEGVVTVLAVPVKRDERIEALLFVHRRTPRPFTDRDEEVLLRLAAHAAVAIENARLYAESGARRRSAEAVAELGRALLQTLDPKIVGQQTADSARALLGARTSALYRLDETGGALVSIAVSGDMGPAFGENVVFPSGTGANGVAVRTRQPIATPDVLTEDRVVLTPELRSRIEQAGYRSVLSVPLFLTDRVIGALSVGDRLGRVFDQDEVQAMQTFAAQAALALENARLYAQTERRRREAETLAEISRALTQTLEPDLIAGTIAERVMGLLEVQTAVFFEILPDSGDLRALAVSGALAPDFKDLVFPKASGLAGLAIHGRRVVTSGDLLGDPRISLTPEARSRLEAGGIRSGLSAPFIVGEEVVGVLSLGDVAGRVFSAADVRTVETLADQAALALQNARLYRDAERRRRETELTAELAQAVNASLDLDIVLQRITDGAKDLVGADMAMIGFREDGEEAVTIRYRVGSRYAPGRTLSIEPGKGIGGQVLLTGRPWRTDDYPADPAFGKEYAPAFREDGPVTAMVVPIKADERVVGVLYVSNRSSRPFTARDETILVRLADSAAIAIKNAQLYARRRQSERRYRSLFENATDPIATFALDGTITSVNPEVERLTGYAGEELLGRHFSELAAPGSAAHLTERARRTLAGEKVPPSVEVVVVRKDGSEAIVEGRFSQIRDNQGRLTGWQVIYRDMTERKRAEQALRASEERYRTLVEGSLQGVCILRNFVTLFANSALARMLGYESPRELIGLDARCWIAPHETPRIEGYAAARLRGEPAPTRYEFQALRKDAALIWADVQVSSIKWDGEPATQLTVFDITERKRAEQALRESSEFNRQIVASAREGIIVYDRELRYRVWNPFVEELAGRRAEEVLGKFCLNVFPILREQGVYDLLQRALAGETVSSPDLPYTNPATGETVWRAGRYGPLLDAEGEIIGVIATIRDVTESRRAEEALRQQEEQLRQSQKMEAVGRLAGGIAHDFNNLLTVITGRGELLLRRLPAEDPVRRDVELIKKTAERAAVLTRQLLAFSRKQMLQPRVLDLNQVVAGVAQMLQRLIGEHIDLVTAFDPNLGLVTADPAQIEQIIVNLAVNSRDAMPQGGRLRIETANVELDEGFVAAHPGAAAGAYAMLAVTDTGEGMTPEVQAHIFEPFFTTKEVGQGTGLGLATVYGIVKQHEGYVAVESAPGAGTTLRVYLRRGEEPAERAEPGPAHPGPPGASETVLLVEDESDVRALASDILDSAGYAVLSAGGPGEALERARRHTGPIHLLLTDVVMPEMSGRDLAGQLTPAHPEMKVLYMSGYTADTIVHHGVLDPGIALLQKPFTPDALTRKVRDVLTS